MKFHIKGNYFDGSFHLPPTSGTDSTDIIIKRNCPADLETLLWECPVDYRHTDPVTESAKKGFETWKRTSLEDRISFLKRYQEEVLSRIDEFSEAIALESGKPLWEAKGEANSVVAKVNVTIQESLPRIKAKDFQDIMPGTQGHIYYKPIGPSLVIGPFNFPCHLANGQILSALIAGNSIIFKPSEKVAYSAQLMIEAFHKAGFPSGVVNMIQGDGEVARRLLNEKSIKGVFFTGSKEVGKKIIASTHQDLTKLVSVELGGKNTAIVHKDTNQEHALTELLKGSFLTSGQRCTSTAIIAIHESLAEGFVERFHQLSKKIIVDHPIDFEREPMMGPLIDQRSVDNYLLFMGMAKREGIEEIMRGKLLEKKFQGHYVCPSIHFSKHFKDESHFLSSEIFGPNVTFVTYQDEEEAISIANKTEYGLAASLFSKDPAFFQLCQRDLEVGIFNLNRSTVGASAKLPFGGVKNSGNYRPAAVTTIDACVYQQACLEIPSDESAGLESIKGLDV